MVLATVLAAALPLAGADAAIAITTGPNLAQHAPNAAFDCRTRPTVVGPQFYGFPDNCTYLGTSASGRATAPPLGGGVVTAVRIKAAAPVGPMQITGVRSIGSTTTGVTCCFYAGESGVFTPRANATTTVRTRLPLDNSINPDAGIQVVDYAALTIRANGVAIPGQYPGNNQFEGSLAFFPRITPADNVTGRVDGWGTSLVPLLSAEITPLCGGGGRVGGAERRVAHAWPADAALPPPPLGAGRAGGRCLGGVSIRDGTIGASGASVPLDCNLTSRCRGKLTLLAKNGKAKLGKAKFKLEPGARKKVKVKLTRTGKKAARGKGSLTAKAKAKVKGGPAETSKIKLKR
ncbi:MAG: hypothetical protein R2718_10050 [Solirubrobacterales bacterium]